MRKRSIAHIASTGSWWGGEDSNLRSLRRQIYSLFPLTAREPPQDLPINRKIGPEKQKIPCGAFLALFFSQLREEKRLPGLIELTGAGEGNRTPNLLITNQLLYRLSYASPGYLPRFFQKSNITFMLKRCQGKNAGTRVLTLILPRACSHDTRVPPALAPRRCSLAGRAAPPAGAPAPSPARSEFRLDLSARYGVSFLCDDLPRPREIERK